jgi:cilia- and flagella-associated protein 57
LVGLNLLLLVSQDITDTFQEELRAAMQKLEALLDDKRHMELEFEDTLKALEERHEREFKELEEQYTTKINAEILRYQELFMEKEAMSRKWDEENQVLIESHAEYLRQITEEYDRKVSGSQNDAGLQV